MVQEGAIATTLLPSSLGCLSVKGEAGTLQPSLKTSNTEPQLHPLCHMTAQHQEPQPQS